MGEINPTEPLPRKSTRVPTYRGVTTESNATSPGAVDSDPRVAITVGVADGFRFGCGMLLAGVVFYCGLVVAVGIVFLILTILGVPLPLGIGGH